MIKKMKKILEKLIKIWKTNKNKKIWNF